MAFFYKFFSLSVFCVWSLIALPQSLFEFIYNLFHYVIVALEKSRVRRKREKAKKKITLNYGIAFEFLYFAFFFSYIYFFCVSKYLANVECCGALVRHSNGWNNKVLVLLCYSFFLVFSFGFVLKLGTVSVSSVSVCVFVPVRRRRAQHIARN